MLSPKSGKDGWWIFNGLEIPIYSWQFSAIRQEKKYRTASSPLRPIREAGITKEQLTIRSTNIIIFDTSQLLNFKIGWNDFSAGFRRYIGFDGYTTGTILDFNYTNSVIPSILWTAIFNGTQIDKQFANILFANLPLVDSVQCGTSHCDNSILTSDVNLNGGIVKHVTSATISTMADQHEEFATASSNNHIKGKPPLFDAFIDLNVQGDFDYWLGKTKGSFLYETYTFSTDIGNLIYDYMSVLAVENITVNLQTGEMIAATVKLGKVRG